MKTVPPLVTWCLAMIWDILVVYGLHAFVYRVSLLRNVPYAPVVTHPGKPPADASAFMYGPGRNRTCRPTSLAISKSFSKLCVPFSKSKELSFALWYPGNCQHEESMRSDV